MAKKAIILLAEGFEEIEAVTCIDILRRAGIKVTVTSIGGLVVTGSRQLSIKADSKIGEVESDYDTVVLPGGMPGAENLANSSQVTTLLKQLNNQKKLIAAICAAPAVVLSPLGLLENKNATCYPGMEKNFSQTTTYQNQKVVIDENIITSQGPATALEFSLIIVEQLSGKEAAKKISAAVLST
jgi:protein deglycase